MSATVLERIDESLGRPATCPHGNVIPGRTPPDGRRLIRLVELEDGDLARVARISEVAEHEAPHLLHLLDERGIVPGIEVGIVSRTRERVESHGRRCADDGRSRDRQGDLGRGARWTLG